MEPTSPVRGRLGRRCLPVPGEGSPHPGAQEPGQPFIPGRGEPRPGAREPGQPLIWSSKPCHYGQGAAEGETPILRMGRQSRLDPAAPEGCGHPACSTPGEAETQGGRGCSGVPSPGKGGRAGKRAIPTGGGDQPGLGARPPREASLTASEAGLAHLQLAPLGEVPA